MAECVAAVDVGTGSARAGIFDAAGRMLARSHRPLDLNRPAAEHAEQDSEQIWDAAMAAVRAARADAGVRASDVRGLAFDATCSLVVRSADGGQLSVSGTGAERWDTMLWQDHRARAEAAAVTATGHPLIARAGGGASPEMPVPKLLWLKRHLPETWHRAGLIFDLTDFLAWKATGTSARSTCTLACKWTYQAHLAAPWQMDFFDRVGLDDLFERTGTPARATPPGEPLGMLHPDAAEKMGLTPDCQVVAGLIDAHAGALGGLGGHLDDAAVPGRRLALVAGTSNCVMALEPEAPPRPGLWGPYKDAILPGLWVREGGQSASGGLLDHICRGWNGIDVPSPDLHARIVARIAELRARDGWSLGAHLHVLPDFAGNRTPHSDPDAGGALAGLRLDASFDGLCRLYWRTCVGLALGLRQIVGHLTGDPDARPDLHLSGGHTRSPMLIGLYASATGCRVLVGEATDTVLLGSAMVAAAGAGWHGSLREAAQAMAQLQTAQDPDPAARSPLERDYAAFLMLQRQQQELAALTRDRS